MRLSNLDPDLALLFLIKLPTKSGPMPKVRIPIKLIKQSKAPRRLTMFPYRGRGGVVLSVTAGAVIIVVSTGVLRGIGFREAWL